MTATTELWTHRGLIGNLAQRELKARYKRSVLGWAWSLINPATTLLTYAVVFGTFLKVTPPVAGNGHLQNFALYLFAGLVVWNFWSAIVNGSMGALIVAGPLLRKVYFPAECPIVANVLVALSQTVIEAGVLVAIMAAFDNVSWTFLYLPVLVLLMILFSVGVGFVMSLVNVFYRDVQYLVAVAMNVLFYATPIVYPLSLVENNAPAPVGDAIRANPLTQFVGAMRSCIYSLQSPSAGQMTYLVVTSTVFALGGWAVFRRFSSTVSEEL